jgi:Tfp pilus assembly protein PilO
MQFDSFQKKIIVQGSISFGLIFFLLLGIYYFGGRINNTSEQIGTIREELANRSRSINSLAALRSEYRTKVIQNLNTMYSYVPTELQLINLRQELQLLAERLNLALTYSFQNESPADPSNLGQYNFRIDVTGNYDALVSLVNSLQHFRYLSTFSAFTLTQSEDKGSLSAKGTVFFKEDTGTPISL